MGHARCDTPNCSALDLWSPRSRALTLLPSRNVDAKQLREPRPDVPPLSQAPLVHHGGTRRTGAKAILGDGELIPRKRIAVQQMLDVILQTQQSVTERPLAGGRRYAFRRHYGLKRAEDGGDAGHAEAGYALETDDEIVWGQTLQRPVFSRDPAGDGGGRGLGTEARHECGRKDGEFSGEPGEVDDAYHFGCFPFGWSVVCELSPAVKGARVIVFEICQGLRVQLCELVLVPETDSSGDLVIGWLSFVIEPVSRQVSTDRAL